MDFWPECFQTILLLTALDRSSFNGSEEKVVVGYMVGRATHGRWSVMVFYYAHCIVLIITVMYCVCARLTTGPR